MDAKDTNPTTQEHHRIANQLMQDLGFEWNFDDNVWTPPKEPVLQGKAVEAVKKLLDRKASNE